MKNTINLFGKNLVQVFGLLVLVIGMFGVTFAGSATKTFEFGAGTANSTSNFRTFFVPCGLNVTASVKYQRKGDGGASSDVPITIELRKPAANADDDGAVAQTVNVTAKRTEQTATLNGTESNRGCSLPWRVRVRPQSGQSEFAIYGNITVSFDDSSKNISVEGNLISLNKGNSVTKNIGGSGGMDQGIITVTAKWNHAIGPVPGPLPVRLKFELIRPNGTVAASDNGFSNAEVNPCCSNNKMKVTFQVAEQITGQWKIRITNNTNDDTMNIDPKVSFKPDCPN